MSSGFDIVWFDGFAIAMTEGLVFMDRREVLKASLASAAAIGRRFRSLDRATLFVRIERSWRGRSARCRQHSQIRTGGRDGDDRTHPTGSN